RALRLGAGRRARAGAPPGTPRPALRGRRRREDEVTGSRTPPWSVVVPTVGRPCLEQMLTSLAGRPPVGAGTRPAEVIVVDDRPLGAGSEALLPTATGWPWPLRVLRSGGRGPAAARNVGWRLAATPWVVFLDDDILLPDGWAD